MAADGQTKRVKKERPQLKPKANGVASSFLESIRTIMKHQSSAQVGPGRRPKNSTNQGKQTARSPAKQRVLMGAACLCDSGTPTSAKARIVRFLVQCTLPCLSLTTQAAPEAIRLRDTRRDVHDFQF